jgi:hypothetical protein
MKKLAFALLTTLGMVLFLFSPTAQAEVIPTNPTDCSVAGGTWYETIATGSRLPFDYNGQSSGDIYHGTTPITAHCELTTAQQKTLCENAGGHWNVNNSVCTTTVCNDGTCVTPSQLERDCTGSDKTFDRNSVSCTCKDTTKSYDIASKTCKALPTSSTNPGNHNCGTDTYFNWGCNGQGITGLLLTILNILSVGVALAVVAGIIIGAIQYTSSGGNPEQSKKAMSMIRNSVIALLMYFAMWALLNFLVPGGVFN